MRTVLFALSAVAVIGVVGSASWADTQAEVDAKMERFYALAKAGSNAEAVTLLREPGFAAAVDKDGHTPLIVAAVTGNNELLSEVLEYPHDLEHRDERACTVVWLVTAQGHNAILERLLRLGAPASTPGHGGTTPLMVAAMSRNHGAVPLLVAAGAPVDAVNEGATALMFAVLTNDPKTVRALLEEGADPSFVYKGKTLLELARRMGRREIELLLLEYQSDDTR